MLSVQRCAASTTSFCSFSKSAKACGSFSFKPSNSAVSFVFSFSSSNNLASFFARSPPSSSLPRFESASLLWASATLALADSISARVCSWSIWSCRSALPGNEKKKFDPPIFSFSTRPSSTRLMFTSATLFIHGTCVINNIQKHGEDEDNVMYWTARFDSALLLRRDPDIISALLNKKIKAILHSRSRIDTSFRSECTNFFLGVDFFCFVVQVKDDLPLFLRGHSFRSHDWLLFNLFKLGSRSNYSTLCLRVLPFEWMKY